MLAADWPRLSRENSKYEEGVSTTITRLDMLFAADPFVSMLDVRLRNKLVVVLAKGHAGWTPELTRGIIKATPYSKLWSSEFIEHVVSLVWLASGREKS